MSVQHPLCALPLLSLAGCMLGPEHRVPPVALTSSYHAASAEQDATIPIAKNWWRSFNDPALTRVVEQALAQNLNIAVAAARVSQSRAAASAAGAALLPEARAEGTVSDVEQSLSSPFGAVGRNIPGFRRHYDLYEVGAAASWEIDIFGGTRRRREANRADAAAAEFDRDALALSIAAETADAYLQFRGIDARLSIAREQARVTAAFAGLVRQRASVGLAADRDAGQALADAKATSAIVPKLEAAATRALNRLDILTGVQAGKYQAELASSDTTFPPVPLPRADEGPAALLRRRADIAAAERRLAAADARIGAAMAEYYPKLNLGGIVGLQTLSGLPLAAGNAFQHQAVAGIRWRLFDFGRVEAEVAGARGVQAEMLASYRKTVLQATGEVENALSDLTRNQQLILILGDEVQARETARRQAHDAYASGVLSLLEVLDADRQAYLAEADLAEARTAALRAAVASFRALGGGWAA